MEHIQARLASLPAELLSARSEEYYAKRDLLQAQNALVLVGGAVLDANPPEGRSKEEREKEARVILNDSEQWRRVQEVVDKMDEAAVMKKLFVLQLQDEFSSLRNLVRLLTAQMMMLAAGVPLDAVPVVDRGLDQELGA